MATSTRKPKSRKWKGRFLRGRASPRAKRFLLPTLQALRTKWIIFSSKLLRCVQTLWIQLPTKDVLGFFCCFCFFYNLFFIHFSLQSCNDRSGVSYQSVMKYIVKKYPVMELDKKKFLIKKALKKHLEKGTIKQVESRRHTDTFSASDCQTCLLCFVKQ